MELQTAEFRSDIYAEFLEEKKRFTKKYRIYGTNLDKRTKKLNKLYKKVAISLDLDKIEKAKNFMIEYKKEILKLLKIHNDMVEEIIYSRYFLLLAKIENKQKADIKKRKFLKKIRTAIKVHKEELQFITKTLKKFNT